MAVLPHARQVHRHLRLPHSNTTIIGMRVEATALLRPFILFHSSPSSPTTVRVAAATSCLQLQRRLSATTTTAMMTQIPLHRRCRVRVLSSRNYYFSLGAPARHHQQQQQQQQQQRSRSALPNCNQYHQQQQRPQRLPLPVLLLPTTTTHRASSSSPKNIVISTEELQSNILRLAKSMSIGLSQQGYWTNQSPFHDIVPRAVIATLRNQAIALRHEGRYEPSYSESVINPHTGETLRFDKPGVYACEPDGADYETAPDMLLYMTILLQTLPTALNHAMKTSISSSDGGCATARWKLDNTAFNAKLAVTQAGGSKYPRHVDNVHGIHAGSHDLRKLTAILYLNPDWTSGDGGELRIYLHQPNNSNNNSNESGDGSSNNNNNNVGMEEGDVGGESFVDLSPVGGRLVLFYSDEVPHEVLENAPHAQVENGMFDRYALTIWIPALLVE